MSRSVSAKNADAIARAQFAVVDVVRAGRPSPWRGLRRRRARCPRRLARAARSGYALRSQRFQACCHSGKVRRSLQEIAEVALVDHREPGERGFVRVAAFGVGVHVVEQRAAELLPVLERARVHRDQDLEGVHRHLAIPVHADLAPRHAARDEQVGGQVEAASDEGGHEVIELLEPSRVQCAWSGVLALSQVAFVMVDAQGVVAQPNQALGQAIRFLVRRGSARRNRGSPRRTAERFRAIARRRTDRRRLTITRPCFPAGASTKPICEKSSAEPGSMSSEVSSGIQSGPAVIVIGSGLAEAGSAAKLAGVREQSAAANSRRAMGRGE